ncbi:UNVERIFIED_ORG: hypothetical protein M2438_005323 [Methylobacterium sp. SuP10 SLI 274]|uniref:hypothetical protein n=1 Tax=Methylorubrum extorquens TaxID=408 RepID=UPI00209ED8A1|nr:hypothetical protein [Methylorubrum extorquens]MDF9861091.1 hypothetical protein [Methylorubrum pseudosasae]MDH6640077.1 hypothetical protein [Methylobacterium sp. SuP10 SLI 274]MDH6669165.1 hypothetical protein [Methylorubrum zatmanii]MCP1556821.1 hypothetical protein [Methylorubrum extorquens]MDF9789412.1 hypothetical protein [Methylorubrum extorquens]
MTARVGHNGGPALGELADTRPGRCKHCRHWMAPSDEEQRAYEWFHLGLSRRRVRRPTGACDRVLVGNNPRPAFSATSAEFGCDNFEAAPPLPIPRGGGFVTIWQDGRIAWQGREEDIPARFLQQDLDL